MAEAGITAMSGKRLTVGVIGNAKKIYFLKGLLVSHLNPKFEVGSFINV